MKTYSELLRFNTFSERLKYLKLDGRIGDDVFGFDRYLNQAFYRSPEWEQVRNLVIIRDNGCDMALPGFDIYGKMYIHHMNPIGKSQILDRAEELLNPEYLITVSQKTHNMIHYGIDDSYTNEPTVRRPGDTKLW